MNKNEIAKQDLYEAVKTLVETEASHIHLPQQKLFTLYSIAFQYMLFRSSKVPGAYIIRIEDSLLADKLTKRSKDPSTRKFMQSLMLPRRLKFGPSTFYLDFFHIGSWALTNDIPREKIKGAVVVKNTSTAPMTELVSDEEEGPVVEFSSLPGNYFLTSLMDVAPKTITIAFDLKIDDVTPINFPFIKKEKEKTISGVTLSKDIDSDDFDD
jgi:hypothetical protein